jgi:hypothetical protein
MCPFCLSTMAIASGGGGLSALALFTQVRRKHSASLEDQQ